MAGRFEADRIVTKSRAPRAWVYRGLPDVAAATPDEVAKLAGEKHNFEKCLRMFEMNLSHGGMKAEQIQRTRCGLKLFGEYLEAIGLDRVQDVTPETIEGFSLWTSTAESNRGSPFASRTIAGRVAELKKFFRWLTARGFLLADPTTKLEYPKVPKTIPRDLPSAEEVERLLDMPDTTIPTGFRDRVMLELLYATGLRSSEITGLDLADFDAAAKTIQVRQGKPKKDRLIPVLGVVCELLTAFIEGPRQELIEKRLDAVCLFPSQWGKRMGRKDFSGKVGEYAKRAGIEKDVTPMAIRHTVATHLLENGAHLRKIQSFLGHKSVETTTIYTKVTPLDLQEKLRHFHPRQREKRAPRRRD